jgi:hypothetical protein
MIIYKDDLSSLKAFYKSRLITSKLSAYANIAKETLQVGTLNYLPNNSNLILDKSSLLTLNSLRKALNLDNNLELGNNQSESSNKISNSEKDLIDDKDILSHPFFQTLKPLD